VSIAHYWQGFYVQAGQGEVPDLELADGAYKICDDFDFRNPKTDYDRACALGGIPAVQMIAVGPGYGLVFATEIDSLTWWQEQQMLVNGWSLPDLSRLGDVDWSDEVVWLSTEEKFLLMNACDHGAAPNKNDWFDVYLGSGEYVVQYGQYVSADSYPAILFRFVPRV
jgi:hypothetical protein